MSRLYYGEVGEKGNDRAGSNIETRENINLLALYRN